MIKRNLIEDLKGHLPFKEISLVSGPRQAGKTTLMLLLKEYLEAQREPTVFLSLDFESHQPFFRSQANLISKIRLEIGDKQGFVFIDEIQRKENGGLFLKGLYDLNLPYKFIVSGSGSLELKEKIHESLVGRKRIFRLNPVSFEEFVNFRTEYRYEGRLTSFFEIEKERTRSLFLEYLNFGGYPRLIVEPEIREKRLIMDDIYHSYLERDVSHLLKVEKSEAFTSLIRLMASQIGRLVNYSELSSTLGISVKTVKNYLWYAEKTFIIDKVSPYFRNVRKEITKSPVYYFTDLGLRNYALNLFGNLDAPSELGFVFQNFVFSLLKQALLFTPGEIHFWRTKDRAEVDFVMEMGKDLIPVEVKFKDLKRPEISRSLRSFVRRYAPENAWIVNLGFRETVPLDRASVHFLPFHDLVPSEKSWEMWGLT